MTVTTLLQGVLYSMRCGCWLLAASLCLCPKLVNSSSSELNLHLSGFLWDGAGWWAARVIGRESSEWGHFWKFSLTYEDTCINFFLIFFAWLLEQFWLMVTNSSAWKYKEFWLLVQAVLPWSTNISDWWCKASESYWWYKKFWLLVQKVLIGGTNSSYW